LLVVLGWVGLGHTKWTHGQLWVGLSWVSEMDPFATLRPS